MIICNILEVSRYIDHFLFAIICACDMFLLMSFMSLYLLHITVVPRTFLGAFILSSITRIISIIIPKRIYNLPSHPMTVQFLIRLQLLLFAWMAHVRLSKALEGYLKDGHIQLSTSSSKEQYIKISTLIANYYLLITASQFHLPYYASRLLPNTFATILVTLSYASWFNNKPYFTAAYLVFTTAIFRCDILLLLFTIGLTMLIRRELSIKHALIIGVSTGVFSLLLTVPLDSFLWRRLIWPEFEVWWFNTVDNRSSEYGVMAFHWYFSRALPKGMLLTALLVPLAFLKLPESSTKQTTTKKESKDLQQATTSRLGMVDLNLLHFFVPVCGFILIYSFLPHKEIRFIFPAIPMFNVCSAYAMSKLHQMSFSDSYYHESLKSKRRNYKLLILRGIYLCGLGSIACTLLGSMIFMNISKENYPGGVALERLRHHLEQECSEKWNTIHVHVDVASAMTGVSLFGQRYISYRHLNREEDVYEGPFRIDKSGYEEENSNKGSTEIASFTHLVTEQRSVEGYHVIDTIQGHPRLDIRNFRIETQDAIYIQERDEY